MLSECIWLGEHAFQEWALICNGAESGGMGPEWSGWVGRVSCSWTVHLWGSCPEFQKRDMGRVRIWITRLSLPISYLQNPSCHDLARVLRPPWPYTQLSCPSTYPSLCLLDIWSFRQWPSFPCNTSVTGPSKFCFENNFFLEEFPASNTNSITHMKKQNVPLAFPCLCPAKFNCLLFTPFFRLCKHWEKYHIFIMIR